ncbi:MAG: hypothetical protein FRX49_08486 [Trebouxia sp. A1-2]|nr:MAG: hypothetical protein FRX49_08486 [Trebouxia sp. A1-2]
MKLLEKVIQAAEGKANLEVRHHLSTLLAQLGLRHLQLAPEAVHLHMGCCQLLPCAPLNPQGTSNRKPLKGNSLTNTKINSCQMASLGDFFRRQLSEVGKWHGSSTGTTGVSSGRPGWAPPLPRRFIGLRT